MKVPFSGGSFIQAFFILLTTLFTIGCSSTSSMTSSKEENSFRLAFGSCNHQWDEQNIWSQVIKDKPDLWIWLGDIIYADTEDMAKMKSDYDRQKNNMLYKEFLNQTEVIGIWDDHDYGANNAGKEFTKKDSSRINLFDFLDVNLTETLQSRKGAYQSYTYQRGELQVKVLLLDSRYFRDQPGTTQGTILGQEQWRWLINELTESTADVHIIGNGIQFLPEDHPYEKWANYPAERQRLLQVIDAVNVANPILISGDRHLGEMSLVSLPITGAPLIEITSSGLTHYYEDFESEPNRHRINSVVPMINFGTIRIEKNQGVVSFSGFIKDKKNKVRASVNGTDLEFLLQEKERAQ